VTDIDFIAEHGLGRIDVGDKGHLRDARNLNFLVQPKSVPVPKRSVAHRDFRLARMHLDQKLTSGCTGWAMAIALNHHPFHKLRQPTLGNNAGSAFYVWATERDIWPGTYDPDTGENDNGSSGGASAQGLRDHGYIREWRWAPTEELFWAALEVGPVAAGTVFKRGMFKPDSEHIIHPTGPDVGGHEYCIDAYDKDTDCFRIDNSWGLDWPGSHLGCAWIKRVDLFDLVFHQDGDFVQLVV
jgi:hypothetical protein